MAPKAPKLPKPLPDLLPCTIGQERIITALRAANAVLCIVMLGTLLTCCLIALVRYTEIKDLLFGIFYAIDFGTDYAKFKFEELAALLDKTLDDITKPISGLVKFTENFSHCDLPHHSWFKRNVSGPIEHFIEHIYELLKSLFCNLTGHQHSGESDFEKLELRYYNCEALLRSKGRDKYNADGCPQISKQYADAVKARRPLNLKRLKELDCNRNGVDAVYCASSLVPPFVNTCLKSGCPDLSCKTPSECSIPEQNNTG